MPIVSVAARAYLGALSMLEELEPEAFVLVRTLDDAWEVCKQDLRLVYKLGVADIGPQRRKGVVGDLGEGSGQLHRERVFPYRGE